MITTIKDKKNIQRKISKSNRHLISKNNLNASKTIIENLKKFNLFNNYQIIASFISIKTEISTKNLNNFILNNKKILCLPVIEQNSDTLSFKEFNYNIKLNPGKYGILEPDHSNKNLLPEIIFIPCLAFDTNGFRLGYGGGYYDRTLYNLKKIDHKFISIAVAFDDQKVDEVIYDKKDQKIDYILTEKYLYKI